MSRISIPDEWSCLEEVILGNASNIYFPRPGTYILKEGFPLWLKAVDRTVCSLFAGQRVPGWICKVFAREIEALHKVLIDHNVRVHRPVPIEPGPDDPPGLSQVFSRDPVITIDKMIIKGRQRLKPLRKEIRGLDYLLCKLANEGAEIASVPSNQEKIFLEGGDVIVDMPYCYVGVGKYASNKSGAQWLQESLGKDITVVPVQVVMPGMFHLDTCLTIIGPKLGIIYRKALVDPLPFPLNTYKFIEVDEKTCRQIGVNVLVLNPETVVIQARHKKLRQALEKEGFKTIGLNFTWHAIAGGAFRCATHPLFRKKYKY